MLSCVFFVIFLSHKKKQRDQLSAWVQEQIERLGPNHQDDELLQTEQCLHEVRKTKLLVFFVIRSVFVKILIQFFLQESTAI